MQEASFTGLLRTLLMIIGAVVVVRFIGRLLSARRDMAEDSRIKAQQEHEKMEREDMKRNYGKTRIIREENTGRRGGVEDVDYTEL